MRHCSVDNELTDGNCCAATIILSFEVPRWSVSTLFLLLHYFKDHLAKGLVPRNTWYRLSANFSINSSAVRFHPPSGLWKNVPYHFFSSPDRWTPNVLQETSWHSEKHVNFQNNRLVLSFAVQFNVVVQYTWIWCGPLVLKTKYPIRSRPQTYDDSGYSRNFPPRHNTESEKTFAFALNCLKIFLCSKVHDFHGLWCQVHLSVQAEQFFWLQNCGSDFAWWRIFAGSLQHPCCEGHVGIDLVHDLDTLLPTCSNSWIFSKSLRWPRNGTQCFQESSNFLAQNSWWLFT